MLTSSHIKLVAFPEKEFQESLFIKNLSGHDRRHILGCWALWSRGRRFKTIRVGVIEREIDEAIIERLGEEVTCTMVFAEGVTLEFLELPFLKPSA